MFLRRSILFVVAVLSFTRGVRAEAPVSPSELNAKAADALAAYVAAPDKEYGWVEKGRSTVLGIKAIELRLTSQNWRGTPWKHKLVILLPANMRHPDRALLFINGGSWRAQDDKDGAPAEIKITKEVAAVAAAAQQLSCPIAVVSQVPFQPMFDGKKEDALIAYTFDQFLRTSDPTWPLLLPMTKSAVRAMDAVQQFLHEKEAVDVKSFTVTGASKRGWTTWLTAAVDPRVSAAAPMVIDMLNMGPHTQHQLEVWGEYSEQIRDYTDLQIQPRMGTDVGLALQRIVDPYAYRRTMNQPKLIMLGTNDPYWPVDSSNLYWDNLPEPKYLTIVPNAGHELGRDFPRVVGGLVALHQSTSGERNMPKMTWQFLPTEHGEKLLVKVDTRPDKASAWLARTPTRDFRKATWSRIDLTEADGAFTATVDVPRGEYVGVFGELTFGAALPLCLSTNVKVFGGE